MLARSFNRYISHTKFTRRYFCSSNHFSKLTQVEKQKFHFMKGAIFNQNIAGLKIILDDKTVKDDNLSVGSVIEDLDKGIKFNVVKWIDVDKGRVIHYMSIPDDVGIAVGNNSLFPEYLATELIVKKIWVSDKDYAKEFTRALIASMPRNDSDL